MRITKVVGEIAESVLSIAGIRIGTEEPHYISTTLTDRVELRKYGPRIAAETTVAADEDRARNIGFRRLANYIFGANHRDEKIAMAAPIAQQSDRPGDEIAMTAPVAQSRASDKGWKIRFFMPSKWTMDTLPTPDDEKVALVTVPGETVAVLRFSRDRSLALSRHGQPSSSTRFVAPESNRPARPPRGSTIRRGPCRSGAATKLPSPSIDDGGQAISAIPSCVDHIRSRIHVGLTSRGRERFSSYSPGRSDGRTAVAHFFETF